MLNTPGLADADPAGPAGSAGGQIDLRAYLKSLDHATLVELLHEHALGDETLGRRLVLRAARQHGGDHPDMVLLGRQTDRALRTRGFTSYHGSFDYARRAQEILEALQELLDLGHAGLVVPLANAPLR